MIVTNNFEEQYLGLRLKEQRLYTDEEVRSLPEIDISHPHYTEWQIRKSSCNKLVEYLSAKKRELNILEVCCGNGWLCSQLSKIENSKVKGIDINKTELLQAKRVFADIENLDFFYSEIVTKNTPHEKFDAIVFAASIQYFSSLDVILPFALELLKSLGEIHILDTNFYKPSEIQAARERSTAYFQFAGFPEMKKHYFHHCMDELKNYNHKILYNPAAFVHFFTKNKNPFPWISIYNHA
jgi:ubiquinone/menaquinone biosynthesis C-methylase UbiE